MAAAEATKKLAESTTAAAGAILAASFKMGAVQRGEYSDAYANISNVPVGGSAAIPTPSFNMGAVQRGEYAPVNVTLELAPNTDTLGQLFYDAFLINQRDGKSQLYNGGIKGG